MQKEPLGGYAGVFWFLASQCVFIDLLHDNKSTAISEFRPKSLQNFLAYLVDRPQNFFTDFVSKF